MSEEAQKKLEELKKSRQNLIDYKNDPLHTKLKSMAINDAIEMLSFIIERGESNGN